MTSGHLLQQLESEMSRVRERIAISERELLPARSGTAGAGKPDRFAASRADCNRANAHAIRNAARRRTRPPRRAAQSTRPAAATTSQRAARVATLEERHRSATTLLQRIEALVSEMRERAATLQTQMESASAEIEQRQNENVQLAEQLLQFEAECSAGEAREGLLQLESEQVRGASRRN